MQEGTMASANNEQEGKMVSTEEDKDADIRQPSINTEPRTLNVMTMERATIAAQKIYSDNPSEDFTKDAFDTATRENAPAEDAGDANSLGNNLDDVIQNTGFVVDTNFTPSKASVPTGAPATPPPTPT